MPEAPWIRRCEHGIRFTDTLHEEEEAEDEEEPHEESCKSEEKVQSKKETKRPNKSQSPKSEKPSHLSEAVIRARKVYLLDNANDGLSDKHKISLFEESKHEDLD